VAAVVMAAAVVVVAGVAGAGVGAEQVDRCS